MQNQCSYSPYYALHLTWIPMANQEWEYSYTGHTEDGERQLARSVVQMLIYKDCNWALIKHIGPNLGRLDKEHHLVQCDQMKNQFFGFTFKVIKGSLVTAGKHTVLFIALGQSQAPDWVKLVLNQIEQAQSNSNSHKMPFKTMAEKTMTQSSIHFLKWHTYKRQIGVWCSFYNTDK